MARLHPRKRVMDFCRAAEQLIARHALAHFSIVGPDDGDLPAVRDFLAQTSNSKDAFATKEHYPTNAP